MKFAEREIILKDGRKRILKPNSSEYAEQMLNCLKKALCAVSAVVTAFSMTGCVDVPRLLNKTKHLDDLRTEIAKGTFVEEWTGDVPEGKMIKYVPVHEWYVGINYYRTDKLYEYDSSGNLTVMVEKKLNEETKAEIIYNDGGLIAARKLKYDRRFSSAMPRREYDCEYEYNGKGHLVCFRTKQKDNVREYDYEYNEEGHLVASYDSSADKTTKYPADPPGTKTCVKLNPNIDFPEPEIVKITYDENGEVKTETVGNTITTYEYSGGKMTGYSVDNGYMVTAYDAENKKLRSESKSTGSIDEYTYNEHGDEVLSTFKSEGELERKTETTYTYDSSGHMTSKTVKTWRKTYKGEEKNTGYVMTYTYDSHGLLVTEEEKNLEGEFTHLKAYFYKAILVPEN